VVGATPKAPLAAMPTRTGSSRTGILIGVGGDDRDVRHTRVGVLIPVGGAVGGLAVSVAAGCDHGLYPAVRAANVPPADALRTV
jgi:putative ABC transport system permease protein